MTHPLEAAVEVRPAESAADADAAGTDMLLGRPAAAWRRAGRTALGLPGDGPLVGTGHQAGPWHPGILAKYALLAAAAGRGIASVDLLVEHDVGHPLETIVPVRGPAGSLHARRVAWATVPEDRSKSALAPVVVRSAAGIGTGAGLAGLAMPAAASRLQRWEAALEAARPGAPHLAGQVRDALAAVLPAPVAPPATWTGSESLLAIPLGRRLLEEMAADPWRCALALAAAVRRHPEAGIAAPLIRDDFVELPLWRIDRDGRRRRAHDTDVVQWLEGGPGAIRLAPRALLLTAVARLGLVDAFIHGRGGAVYDRAMASWVRRWLGVRPAPAVVASADLRLDLGIGRASRTAGAAREQRLVAAHRVWHDPEPGGDENGGEVGDVVGDEARPGPVKQELLAAIAAAPRGSAARRRAWRRMHRQLEALRGIHVGRVESAARRATEATRAATAVAVAARRDWFAMLHEPPQLEAMAAAVAEAPPALTFLQGLSVVRSADPSGVPAPTTGGPAPPVRPVRSGAPPA